MIRARVTTLDDSGAGTIGQPPSWFAGFTYPGGTDAHQTEISNLGRDLMNESAARDLLTPPDMLLVNGEIVVAGKPDSDIILYFDPSL